MSLPEKGPLEGLIVGSKPHVKSWEGGEYNIQNRSIEEEYGFGIACGNRSSGSSRCAKK